MESRYGESCRGYNTGESRRSTYSEPKKITSDRLEELRGQLAQLKEEIQKEKDRQEAERAEETRLLSQIKEAQEELGRLRGR